MKKYNFSPGPARLDPSIISKSKEALSDFDGTGISILEIGHRSKEFDNLMNNLENNIRDIFKISSDFFLLFLQGGATFQNTFIANNFEPTKKSLGCLVTGSWGQATYDDFSKSRKTKLIKINDEDIENFINNSTKIDDVEYLHVTSNETINGVQIRDFNKINHKSLLIDMSSDFGSYKFDWRNIAYVYAGAQKNMGIPGVSICIGDKNHLNIEDNPKYLSINQLVEKKSLLNTPPTFSIYILKLVVDWMIEMGGLEYFEDKSIKQSNRLYDQLESYQNVINLPVSKYVRSRSNIVFNFNNMDLEDRFLNEADSKGIIGINGHRSVGGVRISLYNSITDEMVDYLSEFIDQFFVNNGK